MKEEAGDLLFTLVNLCRFAGVDAEAALRTSLGKFTNRFAYIERELAERGKTPAESTLAEMDRLWDEAKERRREILKAHEIFSLRHRDGLRRRRPPLLRIPG